MTSTPSAMPSSGPATRCAQQRLAIGDEQDEDDVDRVIATVRPTAIRQRAASSARSLVETGSTGRNHIRPGKTARAGSLAECPGSRGTATRHHAPRSGRAPVSGRPCCLRDRGRPRARMAASPAARRLRAARGRREVAGLLVGRQPQGHGDASGRTRVEHHLRLDRLVVPTKGAPGATVPMVLRAHSSDAPIVRSKRLIS